MKKYPSNKTETLSKHKKWYKTKKVKGISNNKTNPHKRWRQSFKAKYPKLDVYVWVDFKVPGYDYLNGQLVSLEYYLDNREEIVNTPDFDSVRVANKAEIHKLLMSEYRNSQGIGLMYSIDFK